MRVLYASALVMGFLALIAWAVAANLAESVAGWEGVDPDRRWGARGRALVAGTLGFGMAGLSAAYAGWGTVMAAVAAAAAAGLSGWLAHRTGAV